MRLSKWAGVALVSWSLGCGVLGGDAPSANDDASDALCAEWMTLLGELPSVAKHGSVAQCTATQLDFHYPNLDGADLSDEAKHQWAMSLGAQGWTIEKQKGTDAMLTKGDVRVMLSSPPNKVTLRVLE